jgi:hypothetical protein
MSAFNEFIKEHGLKELIRKGGKFTWTNKQANPVMSILDRVSMSPRWDVTCKWASCESLTRVGSDHCPILVNTDDQRFQQQHCFRFETTWLLQDRFRQVVLKYWPERGEKRIQDHWRDVRVATRKFCKGWGANINSHMRREKKDLLAKLYIIYREADLSVLDEMRWKERYEQLEEQL